MPSNNSPSSLKTLANWLAKIESMVLAALLFALLLLATGEILARLLFGLGFPWIASLLKMLVLWLAMLGAMAGARDNRHISIDVASAYLKPEHLRWLGVLTSFVAALVSLALAWYGRELVLLEKSFPQTGVAGLETWLFQIIIPFGFLVIGLRYLVHSFEFATGANSINQRELA